MQMLSACALRHPETVTVASRHAACSCLSAYVQVPLLPCRLPLPQGLRRRQDNTHEQVGKLQGLGWTQLGL